jgi:hypothetical protein
MEPFSSSCNLCLCFAHISEDRTPVRAKSYLVNDPMKARMMGLLYSCSANIFVQGKKI